MLIIALRAKLQQTGNSLKNLIAPLDSSANADRYVFRVHKERVYYVRLSIANLAVSIGTFFSSPLQFPPPSRKQSLRKQATYMPY